MFQSEELEAIYEAHPGIPKTIVKKIYEWKVSRDPDIFPIYYDRSRTASARSFSMSDPSLASTSPTSSSHLAISSTGMGSIRKQEPIILTVRNRQGRPV